jgi:hypothetical protein
MDSYVKTYVKLHIRIDAGNRAWDFKDEKNPVQLQVHMSNGVRKVVLPPKLTKILYSFEDLKRAGCKCDTITLKTLAQAGAEGRWKDNIEVRTKSGLPSNVYIANARSIQYAQEKGKEIPPAKFIGRMRDKMTEVYDTVDEVVDAIANEKWRTEFSRGRHAKRK